MIFMQQMQCNAPNRMHVFQTFSESDTSGPLLTLGPRIVPIPSKILAAHLDYL